MIVLDVSQKVLNTGGVIVDSGTTGNEILGNTIGLSSDELSVVPNLQRAIFRS